MNEALKLTEEVITKAKLIEKYLDGEITQEEKMVLDTWISESSENKALFEQLTTRESLRTLMKQYEQAQQRKDEAKIRAHQMTFGAAAVVLPMSSVLKRLSVAAAAILVIATGAYLLFHHKGNQEIVKKDEKKTPVTNDVLPGSYKARLTLADGSTIVLDSAAQGQLTKQGNTGVLNKEGGLVYERAMQRTKEVLYNTLSTAKGEIYSLQLSDGTRIWLNSASSVRYPVVFNGQERAIEIEGEVYVEVAKLGSHKPFVATTNGMQVKVLGTHFNINAYPDEAQIRTTLLEGSVQVTAPGGGKSGIMKPGQQSAVSRTGNKLEINDDADVEQAVAWKNGYFQFNGEDLQTVMRQLERWYDVQVVYESSIPEKHFGGKIPRNANASEVLKVLELSDVHFRIQGKKIIVMP